MTENTTYDQLKTQRHLSLEWRGINSTQICFEKSCFSFKKDHVTYTIEIAVIGDEKKISISVDTPTTFEKIYHYSLILEYFLTAPYGQLQRFIETKKGVKPEYNEETLDETKKASLKDIYDSIIEYFKDINRLEKYLQYYPSKRLLCRIYVAMVESGIISTNVKDKFDFTDAYCSDSVRNVFKIISRY